jgi:vitamin K-dependent gamma-carboxylase
MTHIFSQDVTQHLNHFYLISLMSFVNIFLPLHRNTSLDVICRPDLRVSKVPAWTLWILVFQLSVPYFFGGVAKFNSDWLQGEPMRGWILEGAPKGHFLTTWWTPYFFALGGLLYDLFAAPMLMWKKTRAVAVAATIFFHISNDNMFTIGIFPWFMLFSTPLYFPEYLEFVFHAEKVFGGEAPQTTKKTLTTPKDRRSSVKWLFMSFVAYNCYMPFRHHLYPGHSGWTEEGHLYAWHMKLRRKNGTAEFTVKFADGSEASVNNKDFLSDRQNSRMSKRPLVVLQFGHHLCKVAGEMAEEDGNGPVEVYVDNQISLNGRRKQHCVDPTVDLCKARMTWGHADWILPLEIPLWDQSISSLMERIELRLGTYFVDTAVFQKIEKLNGGGSADTTTEELRFGKVTAYNETENTWTVRFGEEVETFNVKDLARSQRLQAQYEHNALGSDVKISEKSEL